MGVGHALRLADADLLDLPERSGDPSGQRAGRADHPLGQQNEAAVDRFDVAVIGAGVTGMATARRLALNGARVLLLEKGADILSGASKSNSALLHTGFDAPEGSLELRCMQQSYAEFMALRDAMNLPVLNTGAKVIAWTDHARRPQPKSKPANHSFPRWPVPPFWCRAR